LYISCFSVTWRTLQFIIISQQAKPEENFRTAQQARFSEKPQKGEIEFVGLKCAKYVFDPTNSSKNSLFCALAFGRRLGWLGRLDFAHQNRLVDIRDIAARMICISVPVKVAAGGFAHQAATTGAIERSRFPLTLGHNVFSLARARAGRNTLKISLYNIRLLLEHRLGCRVRSFAYMTLQTPQISQKATPTSPNERLRVFQRS
jgi:hypothetical protein